jgi:hypothetical protein
MRARPSMRILALASTLALASVPGCGSKIDGTYADSTGMATVTFKPNGKATFKTIAGTQDDVDYTVDGDKVTLKIAGSDVTLTRTSDGSLTMAGTGAALKKKG